MAYPRLNLDTGLGGPHFGLMHLVATNLILWVRTVIKESMLEYAELTKEEGDSEEEDESEPVEKGNINCLSYNTNIIEIVVNKKILLHLASIIIG